MKPYRFENPCFVKTAYKPAHYPVLRDEGGQTLPEIAAVGRSNVGKSSLLNHLCRRKGLARISSMPGKTQALNFFTLDGRLGLVDFPGYGYAKVPQALRRHWGPMTAEYIEQRSQLRLMLLLIDIRRIPSGEDLQLIEWSAHHGIELVVVLTKVDKLKSGQRAAARQKIAQTLGVQPSDCVYYSSSKNIGRHELIQRINAGLRDAEARLATDQGGHNGTAA